MCVGECVCVLNLIRCYAFMYNLAVYDVFLTRRSSVLYFEFGWKVGAVVSESEISEDGLECRLNGYDINRRLSLTAAIRVAVTPVIWP